MQITMKLRLNNIISLGMVLLILLSLAWSFREIIIAGRNIKLGEEMREIAFDRILLRDEYLLYQEDRAKIQWHAKSEALRHLLDRAVTSFDQNGDKALLEDARKDFDATFFGVTKIMEYRARQAPGANTKSAFSDAESQLISQTILKAYSLTDNIRRLQESAHKTATSARNRGAFLIVISVFGGIIAIIINTTVISRTLAKRITALGKGVEIIGAGDLEHRIVVEGNDELSVLALTSNIMAAKLSESYTSVDNLLREIAGRTKAEEERERIILELKAALDKVKSLSGMLPICASCKKIRDDTGYWSAVESYISEHTDAVFSHGFCPECENKMYAELETLKKRTPEIHTQVKTEVSRAE